jgi:hypothetical protein
MKTSHPRAASHGPDLRIVRLNAHRKLNSGPTPTDFTRSMIHMWLFIVEMYALSGATVRTFDPVLCG